jgi:hypothetical protein
MRDANLLSYQLPFGFKHLLLIGDAFHFLKSFGFRERCLWLGDELLFPAHHCRNTRAEPAQRVSRNCRFVTGEASPRRRRRSRRDRRGHLGQWFVLVVGARGTPWRERCALAAVLLEAHRTPLRICDAVSNRTPMAFSRPL